MQDISTARIGIVGLGYVGLPLAIEFGKKYPTIGLDVKTKRIDELKSGVDSTCEVDADELASTGQLSFTSDIGDLADCNVYIVTVPTPIDENKRPDLSPLIGASETVGKVLGTGDVVVYESTVYPGATEICDGLNNDCHDPDWPVLPQTEDDSVSEDLRRKLRVIARTPLFSDLDARNQRLLAFSAQWYDAEPGQRIFSRGERADAAYLCLSGSAMMSYSDVDGIAHDVTAVGPGRLIGDLAIILKEPRQLDLDAIEKTQFLRIGAEQFRAVIEHDPIVLMNLLKTVAGHLTGAAELLREARVDIPQDAGPPAPKATAPH